MFKTKIKHLKKNNNKRGIFVYIQFQKRIEFNFFKLMDFRKNSKKFNYW